MSAKRERFPVQTLIGFEGPEAFQIERYKMKIYEASIKYSLVSECQSSALDCPAMIYQYMQGAFDNYPMQESFWVICMNRKNQPISRTMISLGTISGTMISPAEVFRVAILGSAANIAVAHQHPSGDPHPSQQDIRATRNLVECGKMMQIPLLDHIICGDPKSDPKGIGYYSFNEGGLC
ncbi:JAB domain-containing protein [Ruficoccus sp. ZRK36]|uniref:JAB domain-containing protein n=1 Tax=Ruficoccus sp. ZRK36 TaxID=2866311 RepID=UPI001C72D9D5|nr:JAB domain-containing protein [Ruficoccus sp. ZRK36]QYY35480.1 JAB domain-containing protein [Ruficoccus sp. ZRK36]